MLVLTDGTPGVEAIRHELSGEGVPTDIVNLKAASLAITRGFLTRPGSGGVKGGKFDGIVLPGTTPKGMTNAERSALARYEREFGVRQVDAYAPPSPRSG